MIRIGFGYDLHVLVEGSRLVLGGVSIPHTHGFQAHSDGDVLAHAIIDGLLGAAALGGIGTHFPDTDPEYENADSMELLAKTVEMLRQAGYGLVNVDANVVAQAPRLNPHIQSIRTSLAERLQLDSGCVSVKAKTNEGVGPEGRGEAISAQAAVLIESRGPKDSGGEDG